MRRKRDQQMIDWRKKNFQLHKLFRRRHLGRSLPCPWEERDRKWGPNKVDKYFSTICFEIFRFHIWLIGINRIMDPLINNHNQTCLPWGQISPRISFGSFWSCLVLLINDQKNIFRNGVGINDSKEGMQYCPKNSVLIFFEIPCRFPWYYIWPSMCL